MKKILFVFFFALLGCYYAEAQSQSNYPTSKGDEYRGYEMDSQSAKKNKKRKKRKSKEPTLAEEINMKQKEYEERMEANVKKYDKIAKEMEKPQYSDPSYFGHKRKPKMRKPGKKKFCKECQLVH